jgi:hypothetical protein
MQPDTSTASGYNSALDFLGGLSSRAIDRLLPAAPATPAAAAPASGMSTGKIVLIVAVGALGIFLLVKLLK